MLDNKIFHVNVVRSHYNIFLQVIGAARLEAKALKMEKEE
jgi:hypothetical protein